MGIEVAQSTTGIAIVPRKYDLDTLEKTVMADCKLVDDMDQNVKLVPGQGELLEDCSKYRRLVGKLNYITIIWPDILFAVTIVHQFPNTV